MVSNNEIRVLYLLPHNGDYGSSVKGYVKVAALDSNPKYEAVSYVWGSSDTLFNIDISDTKVGVTQNLYSLLKRLRLADETRALWIDQLCINQWDNQEKAQQVRLMRQIYSKCQNCQIWMGELSEGISQTDAEEAVEIVKYMAALAEAGGEEEGIARPSSLESDDSFKGPLKALESLGIDTNPWWSRVWTVQEAVLPPRQTILWGSIKFPWETLSRATETWTGDMPNLLSERFAAMETLGHLMAAIIWMSIAKGGTDPPEYVITRYRTRKATDPRDKIYALMGLFPRGTLPTVEECDYDTSVVDVFCDLTFGLMISDESLLPLIMNPRLEADIATPGIPRWVLDVVHPAKHTTDWFHLYGWPEYSAHGDRFLDISEMLERRQESKHTLELKGAFIDTVEIVGETWLLPRPSDSDFYSDQRDLIRKWELIAQEHTKKLTPDTPCSYRGEMSFREAFGRLMLGNLLRDDEHQVEGPADDEDVEEVYGFLETGEESYVGSTIDGVMKNQRLFLTKTGLMGIGHMDTQPRQEVWVFYGGNLPFTVSRREGGGENDYDFGGLCYVQGMMSGEAFERGEEERILTIH